jgi:NAD(P)-dependent dehydrogenase (short-subunit alcohol dehydrogenase family)
VYGLDGRVAVVSGAATGIGRAIAMRLAGEGALVEILDVQDAASTCEEIRAAGGAANSEICDVTNEDQIAAALKAIADRHHMVDILVNNAGILSGRQPAHTLSRFVQDQLLVLQAIYPLLKKSTHGRLINIASRTNFLAHPSQIAYVAVTGMTRLLAREMGEDSITVNAVAPGMSAMTETQADSPEEAFSEVMMKQAIKKSVRPEHVAALVAFIASDEAELITGQMILCDGGGFLD